ncbi:hypothetical protein KR084_008794 [Drosophila pseudotakahashii]|nr:hypothetical protein KR084_008794 [Drosophila pseudotakahashii]
MEEKCLVCLESLEVSAKEVGISIVDMVSESTGFLVEKGNSISEIICQPCGENAQNAIDIKKSYKGSHSLSCQLKQEQIANAFYRTMDQEQDSNAGSFADDSGNGDELKVDLQLPFKCPHCPKRCKLKGNLLKHIRLHSDERPYKCDHCQTSFKDSSAMKKHIRIHTGERPFKCTKCPKSFSYSGSLRDHMLGHSGERPHKCPHCSTTFRWQKLLTIHLRTHTGERPFKCSECSKSFTARSTLETHMRTHTGENAIRMPGVPKVLQHQAESAGAHGNTQGLNC